MNAGNANVNLTRTIVENTPVSAIKPYNNEHHVGDIFQMRTVYCMIHICQNLFLRLCDLQTIPLGPYCSIHNAGFGGIFQSAFLKILITIFYNFLYTFYNLNSFFIYSVADLPGRPTLRSGGTNRLMVPSVRRPTVGDRAFTVAGPRVWNTLPEQITTSQSLSTFRQRLKTWLFRKSYPGIYIWTNIFRPGNGSPGTSNVVVDLLWVVGSTKAFSFHNWSSSNFALRLVTTLSTFSPCRIFKVSPN